MGLLMRRHESYRNRDAAPAPQAPGKPIEELTVPELKALAAQLQIDLGQAKKKAEILAVLDEAFTARANAGNPVGELIASRNLTD